MDILNVLVLIIGLKSSFAIEDYCSLNTFNHLGTGMRFTKEATDEEFAIAGKFKGLHCCAKGYRSLEWYKDGQAYPWGLDLSTLIIFTESANQTIYTQNIREDDKGNYTCVLTNDTDVHTHTINLKVFDKLPDDPKITYVSQDKDTVLGDPMRLFCEAFGGRIDLPDAHSDVVWYKHLSNGTLVEVSESLLQEKISREEGQTFGTYLIFPEIRKDQYGVYTCVISKPGNTISKKVTVREKEKVIKYIDLNPFPVKEMVLCTLFLVLMLTTVLVLVKQYFLKVQLILKDRYGPLEENDGKIYDGLVAYAPKDSDIALGVLVPTLERKGYSCVTKELSQDISKWSTELARHVQSSRRMITVISPAALNDTWASSNLYQAIKQLQTLDSPKLICVALKELPSSHHDTKNSIGETLASLTKSINLILWERNSDKKFWLSMFKEMPARRARMNSNSGIEMKQQSSTRPRLTSERSFDRLVIV